MVANGTLRVCTYMLITLVPLYVLSRGATATVAGLTTTCYMLAAVLARPVSGRLVDVRGRYLVMVAGATLYCLATGLYALTIPVWLVLGARALQGIGFSLNGTAVMTLATDLIPESRMAEGIGYLGLEQTVAQLFAPWLALAVQDAYGYRAAFSLVFGFGLITFLMRFPLRTVARAGDAARRAVPVPDSTSAWWTRIVDRDAWRPALIMFMLMLGGTVVNTFLAAYVAGHGVNAGPFYTASAVAVAGSRLLGGRLQRRIGTGWTIAPGILLIAAGLLGVYWSPNLAVLMTSGACYGWGMGAVQPGLNSLAVLSAAKHRRGLANSTYFMALDLAQAIGAVTLGAFAELAGMSTVFLLAAAIATATCGTYLTLRARGFVG